MTNIILKKDKEQSLKRFHLWLFSGAIQSVEGDDPQDGDIVDVYNSSKEFLARGFCSLGSIAVRVLTFSKEEIDLSWWIGKINVAYQMRKALELTNNQTTTCYRLVHGEGDFLPGLVVDIYDKVAVIQAHCTGIYIARDTIAQAIKDVMQDKIEAVYDKSRGTMPSAAEMDVQDGFILGESNIEAVVKENNLKFNVNWHEGQKTGFFIDQRDNRELVKRYARGKRVLNTFCYTGGFSVYALEGGAKEVVSVDSSSKAIELSCKNVELNFNADAPHIGITIDAFDYLKDLENQKFDLIILDPPAFAKHQKAAQNALKGYKRINLNAIKNIAPGGILFTFSCSQAIDKEQFRNAVFSAAAIAGRKVRILHFLSQAEDHPVNIYHPESEYLKGLVVYVE
ncbi:MAG: class I SAM-dependent rRNA methyltransferase [Rikenellaceae bacterium]